MHNRQLFPRKICAWPCCHDTEPQYYENINPSKLVGEWSCPYSKGCSASSGYVHLRQCKWKSWCSRTVIGCTVCLLLVGQVLVCSSIVLIICSAVRRTCSSSCINAFVFQWRLKGEPATMLAHRDQDICKELPTTASADTAQGEGL